MSHSTESSPALPPFAPTKTEPEILQNWKKSGLRNKLLAKNKGKKSFFFLQGPPYTSGRLHCGHAWNHALKDMTMRYKRMTGHDVFDRAGYDMHGLPTEAKVMAKFNLKDKHAIEEFGYERFADECMKFCKENANLMNEDLARLGVEMDFSRPYMPVNDEYINGVWWLIKTLHEKGRLYEGFRTMSWDWMHETALSKHELVYKTVKDMSIFVRFPLRDKPNTSLIIWTTTPWTIPFNLAVMVNPELDYCYCNVVWEGKPEQWIIARELAGVFVQGVANQPLNIAKTVKGKELEGIHYVHPFHDEMKAHYEKIAHDQKEANQKPTLHSVLMSEEYVDTSAGTGLVHCAPGCGPEDFEVGWRNGLPAFNLLDEQGIFPQSTGMFAGRCAIPDNKRFIKDLDARKYLVAQNIIEHEYPHAQRSGAAVIFRATRQWFWKIEDLKGRMLEENDKVHWVPKSGYNSFSNWLENLRDNSITKQRFWGTPVPIWRNIENDEDILVIGSITELEQLSGQKNIQLHKPWIDDVVIKKDGKTYKRLPDVLDVWIDAGSASWNTLDYPIRTDLFKQLYPADFICEGTDQIRGWFNLLMVSSIAAFDRPSFKSVYMHGMLTDVDGVKMSKSLGNIISPYDIVEKYGADTLRYYFTKTRAGEDISFSWDELELHNRNLRVLQNLVVLFDQTHQQLLSDLEKEEKTKADNVPNVTILPNEHELDMMDRYMLARLHLGLKDANEAWSRYELFAIPAIIEQIFLDASRVYVQSKRDALAEHAPERLTALRVLYHTLTRSLIALAPVCPFITDQLYSYIASKVEHKHESVHLQEYPHSQSKWCNQQIVDDVQIANDYAREVLGVREQIKRNVRFPLGDVYLIASDAQKIDSLKRMREYIQEAINAKAVHISQSHDAQSFRLEPQYKTLGKKCGQDTPQVGELIKQMSAGDYRALLAGRKLTLSHAGKEYTINPEDVVAKIVLKEDYVGSSIILFHNSFSKELEMEGLAREFARRVQDLRKQSGLTKQQLASVSYNADGLLAESIEKHKDALLKKCTLSSCVLNKNVPANELIKEFNVGVMLK